VVKSRSPLTTFQQQTYKRNRNLPFETPGTIGIVADLKVPENRAASENGIQGTLILGNLPLVINEGLRSHPT